MSEAEFVYPEAFSKPKLLDRFIEKLPDRLNQSDSLQLPDSVKEKNLPHLIWADNRRARVALTDEVRSIWLFAEDQPSLPDQSVQRWYISADDESYAVEELPPQVALNIYLVDIVNSHRRVCFKSVEQFNQEIAVHNEMIKNLFASTWRQQLNWHKLTPEILNSLGIKYE